MAVVVIGLLLGAAVAWSAGQDRDQARDGSGDGVPDQQQLQDGSCKDAVAFGQDRDQVRDGSGDGVPDTDRARDQARDGSCIA